MSCGPTADPKRYGCREVYYPQVLEEVPTISGGATGEVEAKCRQRDTEDLGHMPLLVCMSGVLWASQAGARFINSNPKSEILESFMGLV